jgi:hypothetical protein
MKIEQIQDFLEENIKEFRSTRKGIKLFNQLGNLKQIENEQIKWEVLAMRFVLSEGNAGPYYSETSIKDGSVVNKFPSHEHLSEEAYKYLLKRAQNTDNEYLKIRYLQIVFSGKSSLKNTNQAREIIDISISILNDQRPFEASDQFDLNNLLINTIFLSHKIQGHRFSEICSIISLFFNDPSNYGIAIPLLKTIYNFRRKFDQSFLISLINKCDKIADYILLNPDGFLGAEFIDNLEKLGNSQSINPQKYQRILGQLFESLAKKRMDDQSKIVPLQNLSKSLLHYRNAGDKENVERIGVLYNEIKNELKLDKFQFEWSTKTQEVVTKYIDNLTNALLNASPFDIYHYLATSEKIFPDGSSIKEGIESEGLKFEDVITLIKFDINNNLNWENGKSSKTKFYDLYKIQFRLITFNLLNRILILGIESRKMDFDSLIDYLQQRTWIGQEFEIEKGQEVIIQYSWLNEIANPILMFFTSIETSLSFPYFIPNYAPIVESLTLKIEPILRDIATFNKVNTKKINRDNQLQEMSIEDLIYGLEEKNILSQTDITYLKYLYTADGENLRNNIAHGFIKSFEHNYFFAFLNIFTILRLSKFVINKKRR